MIQSRMISATALFRRAASECVLEEADVMFLDPGENRDGGIGVRLSRSHVDVAAYEQALCDHSY